MEPAAARERPPVFFCHGCTARVSATRTPTQELECNECNHTFVEELTQSVVGDEALGNFSHPAPAPPSSSSSAAGTRRGDEQAEGGGRRGSLGGIGGDGNVGDSILQVLGLMGDIPQTFGRPSRSLGMPGAGRRVGAGAGTAEGGAGGGGDGPVANAGQETMFGSRGSISGGMRNYSRSSLRRLGGNGLGSSSSSSSASTLSNSNNTTSATTSTSATLATGTAGVGGGGDGGDGDGSTQQLDPATAATEVDSQEAAEGNIANSVESVPQDFLGEGMVPPVQQQREGGGGVGGGEGAGRGGGTRGRGRAGGTQNSENPILSNTLLQAMGGSGSGHTEIFIGPNIQRVAAGGLRGGGGGGGGGSDAMGGRGTAGVEGLESLGFLLRGMGMVALGGGGGNIGNVGDYAFGDLSNLIQQLMAADPNRHGPPPASKDVVANLPKIQILEGATLKGQECAVCKDDFVVGEMARELPCKHSFHEQCILPWVAERNTCPTCRHELPTDDNAPVGGGDGDGGNGESDNSTQSQSRTTPGSTAGSSATSTTRDGSRSRRLGSGARGGNASGAEGRGSRASSSSAAGSDTGFPFASFARPRGRR